MDHLRYAVHRDFERNRDLLLDLFRRDSRPLGDYLYIVISDVGIGLDREALKGNDSAGEKDQGEGQYQQAIVESEVNDTSNHSGFRSFGVQIRWRFQQTSTPHHRTMQT